MDKPQFRYNPATGMTALKVDETREIAAFGPREEVEKILLDIFNDRRKP